MTTKEYNATLTKIEKTVAIATGGDSTKVRIAKLMAENKGMTKSAAGKIVRKAKHVSAGRLQADIVALLTSGKYEFTSLRFFAKSGTIGAYMRPTAKPENKAKRKHSAKSAKKTPSKPASK
jgi:hypothetical protein